MNKPLPPGENGMSAPGIGGGAYASQQGVPNAGTAGGPYMSQSGVGGLGSQGSQSGPGTPTRGGQNAAPSVVISPSAGGTAPVCRTSITQPLQSLFILNPRLPTYLAHPTSRRSRNHAWRLGPSSTWAKVRRL